jgi:ArsR family transcriptional regulator
MYALPLGDGMADVVLLHQVLHYAHAPSAVIAEAARVLAPGGRLLVVDFDQHEREDLRERAQHVRLGFSDEAMLAWIKAAGLRPARVDRLAGGELTVSLWAGTKAQLRRSSRKAA